MKKQEALEIIKGSCTTYLLGCLIHSKANKQIKDLIKAELIKRGALK